MIKVKQEVILYKTKEININFSINRKIIAFSPLFCISGYKEMILYESAIQGEMAPFYFKRFSNNHKGLTYKKMRYIVSELYEKQLTIKEESGTLEK